MKFPMVCLTCSVERPQSAASLQLLGVRDDGRYEVICDRGHKDAFVVQNPKFDILFEIGANAILDGYYREAVSSFQASLERCYEFFVRVALRHMGLPDEAVANAWKQIGKQSERQLGGFVLLYTMQFGRAPALLSNKNVEFRNAVIHAGTIPSREQAVEYGQAVLDIERPLIREMKSRYPKAVTSLAAQAVAKARKPDDPRVSTAGLSTIVGFQVEDHVSEAGESTQHHERPLELALSELARHRVFQADLFERSKLLPE